MSTERLVADLVAQGVQLWAEGDELCYRLSEAWRVPAVREALRQHKAEILALLGDGGKHAVLSSSQVRQWFLVQLEPDAPAYNLFAAWRLAGGPEVGALRAAIARIVRRHEALRTVFVTLDDRPVQVVRPAGAAPDRWLPVIDLSRLGRRAREVEARRLAGVEIAHLFDLTAESMLRTLLLRFGCREHWLLVNLHHIAADGWSTGIFYRELAALYAAAVEKRSPRLPALPLQYADFASWQRGWLASDQMAAQLAYWRRQLAGSAALELPTDRPRPAVQTYRGAVLPLALDEDLVAALSRLSQRHGATLFMGLQAAFMTLLQRTTGQRDVAVGSPVANRPGEELERLIGFFVNTLTLRASLSPESRFSEVLEQLGEVCLEAFSHQDLPFEKLVEELAPERDMSRHALFQVFFALQNVPFPDVELPGLTMSPVAIEGRAVRLDLELYLWQRGSRLEGMAVYNTDLFDGTTVARWVKQLKRLCRAAAADPRRRLAELALLAPVQRHQLIVEWNDRRCEAAGAGLYDLFASRAASAPDAIAVVAGDRQLSYGELGRRSSRLAGRLRRLGVGPEVLVGLCARRSTELVVALLGVIETGGAYVPLDPAHPSERLTRILDDAGVGLLLTEEELLRRLPSGGRRWLCLDGGEGEGDASGGIEARAENLAYVIYTSGSTGRPKGVAVSVGAVVNLLASMSQQPGLTAADTLLAVTTISFDIAVLELFLPLIRGARLVIAGRETAADGLALAALLTASRATVVQATPASWRLLLAAGGEGLSGLAVLCGGEALPGALAAELVTRGARLWNLYGPTETTVWSAVRHVRRGAGGGPESLGRPIANTRIHMLDGAQRPVPPGRIAELAIGGAGLARGYLGRPARTAAAFVPDPWSDPGARLYRTGDQGRRLADGDLQFVGRLDHQVKIRGFRIEPGEIEARLRRHPAVGDAVVIARDEAAGGQRLVAYVVFERDGGRRRTVGEAELSSHLAASLPGYMIPSALVSLDAWPLSPSGKIDRRALPAPADPGSGSRPPFAAPRTPTEEVLAGIWSQVLGRERVGRGDNFFELGGHSLLATQVISRVRQGLAAELQVRELFETPTVAALAERVELARRGSAGRGRAAPPIVPCSGDGPYPLSFAQQRLWFLDQLRPNSAFYNLPVAVTAAGRLDVRALWLSLGEIVRRHDALRTTFVAVAGEPKQQVLEASSSARSPRLPLIDLVELAPATREIEARRLAREAAERPFDLERGPLWRVSLLRLEPERHALVLVQHHILSDGWSLDVWRRELATLYGEASARAAKSGSGAAAAGVRGELPELPIRYVDYCAWQRQWLEGEVLAERLAFWKRLLADYPPVLALPTDRPRPPIQTLRGGVLPAALPVELLSGLSALSHRQGTTLAMTMLAGFYILLSRITGRSRILVGSPVAGRTHREIEDLIGFFANTLALPGDLSPAPDGRPLNCRELLGRVREMALGAYSHADLPFERLVQALEQTRDLSRNPLFQVIFALQNAPIDGWRLPGLAVRPMDFGFQSIRFDLEVSFWQEGEVLHGGCAYNRDLFDATTAARWMSSYRTLLEHMVACPDADPASLPWLAGAQRHQLLVEWSRSLPAPVTAAAGEAAAGTAADLFKRRAVAAPDAIALRAGPGERAWSYGELARRSRLLARRLRSLGVGPEVVVGVLAGRSPELVLSCLAVLEAGGAYLALDPDSPRRRREWMLRDARAPVVLIVAALAGAAGTEAAGIRELVVDAGRPPAADGGRRAPAPAIRGRSLAYVIYTSGSTGRPKAVAISHRSLSSLIGWHRDACGLGAGDRMTQVAAVGFDAMTIEIWPALAAGAGLCLPDDETRLDPAEMLRYLAARRITVAFLPTPLAEAALAEGLPVGSNLRLLFTGGDVLRRLARRPACRLVNHYGPSENTVAATAALVAGDVPPIGRPIPHVRTWVADARGRSLPAGVPGELRLGGGGLARGYLRRPGLTAERFVPDPLGGGPGRRLYRTGDRVRLLADGNLDFLGRADDQVKIRGVRVEPGEIAAVLAEHPAVRQAVVTATPVGEGRAGSGEPRFAAYLTLSAEASPEALRGHLAARLPAVMVPADFVVLQALPLTAHGKVDRDALPRPVRPDVTPEEMPGDRLETVLKEIWQEVLGIERLGVGDSFFELGGHSMALLRVRARLQAVLPGAGALPVAELFEHPTIRSLARHLEARLRPALRGRERGPRPARGAAGRRDPGDRQGEPIAIVAVAGRFPGARDVEQLWRNLCAGVESIAFFDDAEVEGGVSAETLQDPDFVKAGGILEDVELFDAAFFDFNPREAELLDPQHRLFLECAWQALERAGHDARRFPGRIGVFAGAGNSSYLLSNLLADPALRRSSVMELTLGNEKDFLPTRVSYKLDLRGPSLGIQTACSTSLVAVATACESLRAGGCEMALAGGVTVHLPQKSGYLYQPGMIVSPDGHCRAFDARARGTVGGNGAGVVVLKRLSDAVADRNPIHAVIRGFAVNNDGALKVGYTAPGVAGQAAAISEALAMAGVDPATVGYVEAHGTGTELGDPIEIAALNRVFGAGRRASCAIGSVKTNLGHLDAAAGAAGLIKTALALERRQIPASLHFDAPNPEIDFDAGPFFVNTALRPWPADPAGVSRRAGVSSFGIGGTNAHVVLEEAPAAEPSGPGRRWQLLTLSARTATALDSAAGRLAAHLRRHPEQPLADVAYTLAVGRRDFEHRRTVAARDREEAAALLSAGGQGVLTREAGSDAEPVVFLFPGQGAQYPGMGLALYRREPLFRRQLDRCARLLAPDLGADLLALLDSRQGETLRRTAVAQPALFAVEYSLARLWMAWGVRPEAMIGHSVGELVAACLAGVFSLPEALSLVACRGRLMQGLPAGEMLAVALPAADAEPLLERGLDLAAVNGPAQCVLAGPAPAVAAAAEELGARGVGCRRLDTSHAFHSRHMEPILEPFRERVAKLDLKPPCMPFFSNLTGTRITAAEATDHEYWVRHLRHTVRFGDALEALGREPEAVLMEVGPGRTLTALAARHPVLAQRMSLACLPRRGDRPPEASLTGALARLWSAGVRVDWEAFYGEERRQRVVLPTYPFERRRYWVEPAGEAIVRPGRRKLADWFYVPSWKRSAVLESPPPGAALGNVLVFVPRGGGLGERAARRLAERGATVTTVAAGGAFARHHAAGYSLDPRRAGDYSRLLRSLVEDGRRPRRVVHCWGAAEPPADARPDGQGWQDAQVSGFYSLLFLARALAEHGIAPLSLAVVTSHVQKVIGDEAVIPARATVLGLARCLPVEIPELRYVSIDVELPESGTAAEAVLADRVAAELESRDDAAVVAYRGRHRWVQIHEAVRLEASAGTPRRLRRRGVFLITGGLGGVGLALAEDLARTVEARLILVGRSAPPARERWRELAAGAGSEAELAGRLLGIKAQAGELLCRRADVTSRRQMAGVLAEIRDRFGGLDGVIHAAGLADAGLLQSKSLEQAARVMAPKVGGTLVLADLLRDEQGLEVFVLCSSLASVLGAPGQSAYCAANAFLDAWAAAAEPRAERLTVAVNWDAWSEAGMARRAAELAGASAGLEGISSSQGGEALRRILGAGCCQVAVSVRDLGARFDQPPAGLREPVADLAAGDGGRSSPEHRRPPLDTPYRAPDSEVERAVADIWQQVLGIAGIGAGDDFFDLGGHSLAATQVLSRLRANLGLELSMDRFFEAPTVAELARRVAADRETPSRPSRRPEAGGPIPVLAREPGRRYPTTFAQRRLWFLDRLSPENPFYNTHAALRLEGPLAAGALETSLNLVVRRHETLRTTFEVAGGEPVQRIREAPARALPRVDLTRLAPGVAEAEARRLSRGVVERPFDLERGPLLRSVLLVLEDQHHLLINVLHHVICDGWSMGVLARELGALYAAVLEAGEARRVPPEGGLPELEVQNADFAVWQRQNLSGRVLEELIAYWRRRLAGAPVLDLMGDRPRPAVQSFRGASHDFELSPELAGDLEALSRGHGATLFMTLLAAFQLLLCRYSGRRDVCVGTPIANRGAPEIEDLIGCFINVLVLRIELTEGMICGELLARVREVALGAYDHQDLPFEILVDELSVARDLSRTPLFQAMFVWQNAPVSELRLPGLRVEPVAVPIGSSAFDLTLSMFPLEGRIAASLEYSTDLFDAATVLRMRRHLAVLLAAMAASPRGRVADLPLLAEAERHQLLREWSRGAPSRPPALIHEIFAARARRAADAVAVSCGEVEVTFGELDRRAARLAGRLRRLGVGPDVPVAAVLERSPELVAAFLGILKAGGVYLPLDAAHPGRRLAFLLADAGASVVVTRTGLARRLREHAAVVVCLDRAGPRAAARPRRVPGPRVRPSHLAYLIYTSGTTGRPKGVMIPHVAVARLWAERCRPVAEPHGRRLRYAWTAPPIFDASIDQLTAVAGGHRLVVVPEEVRLDTRAMVALLRTRQVDVLDLTPQELRLLLDRGLFAGRAPATVVVGGEAVPAALWQRLARVTSTRCTNLYGPTEATVDATSAPVVAGAERPHIGRPLSYVRLYVLDRSARPAAAGVPGELAIAGGGLARGYLARPGRTAERFVPEPSGGGGDRVPGTRAYLTGDRVRTLHDGNLEFLGRLDHQVKLRGLRIELGEIEAVLAAHRQVAAACVVAHGEGSGEAARRLVAFVVPRAVSPGAEAWREHLRAWLPEPTIPALFVELEELPVLANGKVDRGALQRRPLPGPTRLSEPPRDWLEHVIRRVWRDALGLAEIGAHDNFFELGGHSLNVVQVREQLRELLDLELSVVEMFQYPTIRELARRARNLAPALPARAGEDRLFVPSRTGSLVPLQPSGSGMPLFFVHGVDGDVLSYLELARALGSGQPFYALRAPGLAGDGEKPLARLEDMAARYLEEIRGVVPRGPYLIGGWSMGGAVAFEMARQLAAAGAGRQSLFLIDCHLPAGEARLGEQDPELWLGFSQSLGLFAGASDADRAARDFWDTLRDLEPAARLRTLLHEARAAGTLPRHAGTSQIRARLEVFRTHVQAHEGYRFRAGPVPSTALFMPAGRPALNRTLAAAWRDLAGRELIVCEVPGDHFSMMRGENARALARRLRSLLEAAHELGVRRRQE